MDLDELARRMGSAHGEPPRPCDEAVVDELRQLLRQYRDSREGCPFQIGDLITPRRGRNLKQQGRPHIVLEVLDPPIRPVVRGPIDHGARFDLRVACWINGDYVALLVESWQYERWQGAA